MKGPFEDENLAAIRAGIEEGERMWAAFYGDLAGELTVRVAGGPRFSDLFPQNLLAVHVEQKLQPAVKYAVMLPMTREAMAYADVAVPSISAAIDRYLRPWLRPDRNPWPRLVLFPRLDHWMQRATR